MMVDLTPKRLAELRRIAEAATPGPWWVDGWEARTKDGDRFIASIAPAFQGARPDASCWEVDANIQHIAAFDPTTALELLDALTAARAEADRWKKQYEALRAEVESVAQELRKLAFSCAQDRWETGYPYHDGASDAYYEAGQMVRQLLAETGGDDQ